MILQGVKGGRCTSLGSTRGFPRAAHQFYGKDALALFGSPPASVRGYRRVPGARPPV